MTPPQDYARAHAAEFRQQLYDLLRIPSVSTEPERRAEVRRAAEWLADELRRIGMTRADVMPTAGHPVVYGEWLGAAGAPTLLIYGHYDVQPAEMADGWTSAPFEPVERDGMIYARGASDDKGQLFTHIKAVESFFQTQGQPPINIKFILEGEEEIGSKNLAPFITEHRDLLMADVCVISDTGMHDPSQPAITYALRGLTYMELHVTGPDHDLHSGGFGGIVHNPALALAQIMGRLHNPDGSIAVPGFYDDVLPLTDDERAAIAETEIREETLRRVAGVPESWGEKGYTLRERQSARPTMEINGLLSGWTGEGSKTVLPAKAMAKISCRLVANQNSHKIYELVKAYIAQITPSTVRSELRLLNTGEPALIPRDVPAMQAAQRAYERGWGSRPIFTREGGSIPVVVDFQRELNGLPVIMLGFGMGTDGAHGPDEHFRISAFEQGIQTAICFIEEIANGIA